MPREWLKMWKSPVTSLLKLKTVLGKLRHTSRSTVLTLTVKLLPVASTTMATAKVLGPNLLITLVEKQPFAPSALGNYIST